jgi:Arc/MetJ-type ribon-helix-helix transcriptional regulator
MVYTSTMAKGYHQLSLPDPLYEQMEEYLKRHSEYTSAADFVKELIRRELKSEK